MSNTLPEISIQKDQAEYQIKIKLDEYQTGDEELLELATDKVKHIFKRMIPEIDEVSKTERSRLAAGISVQKQLGT